MTTLSWNPSSPEASDAAKAAISDWPPGIATLVLSTGYKLYAADRSGIRWRHEMLTRPAEMVLFDGVAVSNNRQFVAYVDHAREIVVRSIRDDTEVGRVPNQVEGETHLRCVSADGNLAVLASVPPDLPQGTTGDRLPWRVTVVDLRSGQVTVEQPLEDLVKERIADYPEAQFTLYLLDWLSQDRLAVTYVGWRGFEAYAHDLQVDLGRYHVEAIIPEK